MMTGRMIGVHQGQRLLFYLETSDDLLRVHARLGDFQSDLASYRCLLIGEPHLAHTAFAELVQQSVLADGAGRAMCLRRYSLRLWDARASTSSRESGAACALSSPRTPASRAASSPQASRR